MRSFPIIRTMVPRDQHEPHRAATPLELLFDLCFVVAVAQAVAQLHHFFVDAHFADGVVRYIMVFFAIWWAWMGFTWFASGYDTDDVAYRLTVMIQIAGNLVMAAGIPRVFADQDFTIITWGYVIMRLGLVGLWIRAARSDPAGGGDQWRSAVGVSIVQVGWLLALALPNQYVVLTWALLVLAEMTVPVWAARAGRNAWHPHHIAERFGLFTIIVLGESVLGATITFQTAVDDGEFGRRILAIAIGGIIGLFSMWWLYFDQPTANLLTQVRSTHLSLRNNAFIFGYGHYFVFATAAAVGGGLEIAVDYATHHAEISARQAAAIVAIPVALYIGAIWILRLLLQQSSRIRSIAYALAIALVLLTILMENPVLPIGLILASLVATLVLTSQPSAAGDSDLPGPTELETSHV